MANRAIILSEETAVEYDKYDRSIGYLAICRYSEPSRRMMLTSEEPDLLLLYILWLLPTLLLN